MQETRTWSPFLKLLTALPVSSTIPTPSWPRMRPGTTSGTSPFRICRSVPHIVVFTTLTRASVGSIIVGFGLVSQAFLPGPLYTRAFMIYFFMVNDNCPFRWQRPSAHGYFQNDRSFREGGS